jgi:hypothetical protein
LQKMHKRELIFSNLRENSFSVTKRNQLYQ